MSLEAKAPDSDLCMKNARSTHDTLNCIDKEYTYYDTLLNRYYKQIKEYFKNDKKEQHLLKEAQLAWIEYRDKKCKFEGYPMRDGSGEKIISFSCRVEATALRAKELKEITDELKSFSEDG